MKQARGCKRPVPEIVTVVSGDPAHERGVLKQIGGSQNDDWSNLLANQAIQALSLKSNDPETRDRQLRPPSRRSPASIQKTSWKG